MTSAPGLQRRLGTADAVFIGLGSMIGAGVFAAFTPAAQAAGSGLLVGLVVAALVAVCNALASAQLAAAYPTSGGTYVYGREQLGAWWGFLAGWSFVIGKTASCAAMALTFASYAAPPGWERPVAVAAVAVLAAVNYRGITRTAQLTRIIVVLVLVALGATYLFASGRPGTSYPIAGIILAVLVLGYSFLTNNTTIGRHIYAVGGNWRAAELSGVNIRRVNFFVMANMSVIAAIAGMLWIARSVASGPGDGVGWELDAIAAVFIGGAAVSGGIGTIVGSIIGGLVIAVLNNGLQLLSVGADRVSIIKGLVLLVAVGIDVYSKRQGKPSIIGLLTRGRKSDGDETPVPAAPAGTQTPTPTGGPQETARPQDLTPEG